jgi:hypothetical protein
MLSLLPSPRPGAVPTGAGSAKGTWGAGSAGGTGRGGGGGRMPRAAGLVWAGAGALWSSISSTCRARLIAAASDWGLWIRTAWLSGGSSPPVKSCTRWRSSSGPARGSSSWKRFWYSTVPVRLHSASSNNGAERRGGPKRNWRMSLKRVQRGVPSFVCSWRYHD